MPKVIVREIDNTKAVVNSYSNFSVAIPGYVKSDKYEEVCDENGVYECSNASDFITYIGKVADVEGKDVAAVAPIVTEYAAGSLKLSEANEKLKNGSFYSKAESTASAEGKLVKKDGTKYYKYTIMSGDEIEECFKEAAGTETESAETDPVNKTALYFISSGEEGIDAYKQGARIGNRLAYMLVQLGYTILYKQIEEDSNLDKSDFWECLKDRSTYDFRYICTGGIYDTSVYQQIIDVVGKYNVKTELTDDKVYGRGDATALIDVCEDSLEDITSQSKCISSIRKWIEKNDGIFQIDGHDVGKYVGIFAPKTSILVAGDTEYGDANSSTIEYMIPGSIYYLACASKAIENGYAEWYPVGGYQRGTSDYTVVGTSLILGERAVQLLEPRVA